MASIRTAKGHFDVRGKTTREGAWESGQQPENHHCGEHEAQSGHTDQSDRPWAWSAVAEAWSRWPKRKRVAFDGDLRKVTCAMMGVLMRC
jgi:hypothetical protein